MPKSSNQPLSQRKQVTQRDTYRYSKGLTVSARPVSTFVEARPSGSLNALIDALNSGRGILGSYAKYKQITNQKEKKAGYEAGLAGKELSAQEDSSSAMMSGWLQAKGEGAALDFENVLHDYYLNNWQADPESFQAGLNQIVDEYTKGKSVDFLKGFVPNAHRIEATIRNQYLTAQHQQMKIEGLGNIGKSFEQKASAFIEDNELSSEERAKRLRQLISAEQARGLSFGLTRQEISDHLIDIIGSQAELKGDPSLMRFAEVPDSQGIKLSQTSSLNKIRMWEQRAVQAHDLMTANIEKKQKEYEKKATTQLERDIVTKLSDTEHLDYKTLLGLKQDILNTWADPAKNPYGIALPPATMKTYLDSINTIISREGFAETSKPETVTKIRTAIADIKSSDDFQDVLKQMELVKGKLSGNDYDDLFKSALKERKKIEDKEVQRFKTLKNDMKSSFKQMLKEIPVDSIFGEEKNKHAKQARDAQRVNFGMAQLSNLTQKYYEEHQKYPDAEDYLKIQKEVYDLAFKAFPRVGDNEPLSNSPANTPPKKDKQPTGGSSRKDLLKRLDNLK